jgi:hypothetical protein
LLTMPIKRNDERFTTTNVSTDAAATENAPRNRQFVSSVGPNDVLLGRGAPMVNFAGNVRFRVLVATRLEEYSRARRRQTKDTIAREIMALVEQRGGRFLRKMDAQEEIELGVPNGSSAWVSVEEDVAIEKVKQALRNREQQRRAPSANDLPPSERREPGDSSQTNRNEPNSSALHTSIAASASGEAEQPISTPVGTTAERAQSAASSGAPPPPLHPLALLWQQQQLEDSILRRQSQQQQAAELLELLQIQQRRHQQQRELEAALLNSAPTLALPTYLGLNPPIASRTIQQLLALRAQAAGLVPMDVASHSLMPSLTSASRVLPNTALLTQSPSLVTGSVPNLTIGQQLLALQNLNQQAATSPTAMPLNLNRFGLGSAAMPNQSPQPPPAASASLAQTSPPIQLQESLRGALGLAAPPGMRSAENGHDSTVASRSALENDRPASDSSSSSSSSSSRNSKGDDDDERKPRSTSVDSKSDDSSSTASTEPSVLKKRPRLEKTK